MDVNRTLIVTQYADTENDINDEMQLNESVS